MELNKIYQCDVLDGLRQLDDESIDLIITSPPYNKAGLNGKEKGLKWHATIDYNGDKDIDNMPETEYQQWQIDILNECYRVLKNDGSMFYNHKNRIATGKGIIINPFSWLCKTDFLIRQEIIWDRGSTMNVRRCRFLPTTEKIFWLTKSISPRFDRKENTSFKNEVWKIQFSNNSEHPAPFPIDIPNNIIPCISQGERITVLDPFMGSGTVALSALRNGCNYIGFELFEKYVNMANNNISTFINTK